MRLETRLHARFAKLAYYQFRKYFEIEFSQFNHEIGDARRSGKRMRFYSFSFETSNKHSRRGKPFSRICILAASVYVYIHWRKKWNVWKSSVLVNLSSRLIRRTTASNSADIRELMETRGSFLGNKDFSTNIERRLMILPESCCKR